ncbi:MAG: HAMP domain-containing histidine kinase [bacterium]|nr:HAMP domain-containing histidine kinase [bacterium]
MTDTKHGPFLSRRDAAGAGTGFFSSYDALGRAVKKHLRLPRFKIRVGNEDSEFGPTATEEGVRVRGATELPGTSLVFELRSTDPERIVHAAREHYYGAIRREADRLRRLVDDVLDFSRIERGEHAKLCIEEVDLGRFLDDVAAQARDKVEASGVRFELERGEVRSTGALDPDAVRRAVWNLVDNALTHSGTEVVRLHTHTVGGGMLGREGRLRGARTPFARTVSDALRKPVGGPPGKSTTSVVLPE